MLRPDALSDDLYVRRFDREISSLQSLTHSNIVRILDDGTTRDGYRFFVMEMLDGRTLLDILDEPARLPYQRVIRIMLEICEGTAYAHSQGFVHRDLKANNVFIVERNDQVVILDFGVARDLKAKQSTMSRQYGTPGTEGHIAPEVRNGQEATYVSDVFALGVIFFHMLMD
jgi:eukaryotic-like serine/threonine-protein kinase